MTIKSYSRSRRGVSEPPIKPPHFLMGFLYGMGGCVLCGIVDAAPKMFGFYYQTSGNGIVLLQCLILIGTVPIMFFCERRDEPFNWKRLAGFFTAIALVVLLLVATAH